MRTTLRIVVVCTTLIGLFVAVPALSSQPTITITDLGGLPGELNSVAFDINESGQVVGGSAFEYGNNLAFMWTAQGGMQVLGIDSGMATGINDLGQIVGSYYDSISGQNHAFFLDGVNLHDIAPPPGGTHSQAWGINNQGQVVGCYGPLFHTQAFIWTEATGMQNISDEYDLGIACANDINELGQVVGSSSYGPFIYTPGVGVHYITDNPSHTAFGLNDAGQVVGRAEHAFLWSAATGMTDLGNPGESSEARDTNDFGQVAGFFSYTDESSHAFFWSEETGRLDLGVLNGDPDSYAMRLNNSGQIVGVSGRAVMWTVALTPPTPQEQIEKIAAKVDVLVSAGALNAGEGNALDSKLDAATAQLNKGATTAARNVLEAFNHQVGALARTERLTFAQAQPLIDAANAVIEQLQ